MKKYEEFAEVYLQYSDKIFRFLYWRASDKRIAEDLTGEVFVKAWKNWKNFKPDYLQAWLYKIASNVLVDYWRSKKNKKDVSLEQSIDEGNEPSYDENLIEKIDKDDEIKKLNHALNSLPKNLKDVAVLRFIEEMKASQVAKILNISEVNVRVLQHRALLKLKEILKNER